MSENEARGYSKRLIEYLGEFQCQSDSYCPKCGYPWEDCGINGKCNG